MTTSTDAPNDLLEYLLKHIGVKLGSNQHISPEINSLDKYQNVKKEIPFDTEAFLYMFSITNENVLVRHK